MHTSFGSIHFIAEVEVDSLGEEMVGCLGDIVALKELQQLEFLGGFDVLRPVCRVFCRMWGTHSLQQDDRFGNIIGNSD